MAFGLSGILSAAAYDDTTTLFDAALFEAYAYYCTGSDGAVGHSNTQPTTYGPELINNGTMETGNPPTGWTNAGGSIVFEQTNALAHSGTYCMHLSAADGGISDGAYTALNAATTVGASYTMSAWYQLRRGSIYFTSNFGLASTTFTTTGTTWTLYTKDYVGTGTGTYFILQDTNQQASEWYLDDVSIRRVYPTSAAYADVWTAYLTATDGSKGGDSYSDVWTAYLTATDGSKGADTLASTATYLRTLTDGSKTADSKVVTATKVVADGSVGADAITSKGVTAVWTDGAKGGDTYSDVWDAYRTWTDGSVGADSYADVWTAYLTATEGVTAADSYDDVWDAYRTFTDGITAAEAAYVVATRTISSWVSDTYVGQRNMFKDWTKRTKQTGQFATKRASASIGWS